MKTCLWISGFRYGNDIILLDATYRTTKYSLPLFFLAVKTNTGYQVVAEFITEHETTAAITKALGVIKKWVNEDVAKPANWQWTPKFGMVDFSEPEIQALESTFSGN